jgi:hypothetical protein
LRNISALQFSIEAHLTDPFLCCFIKHDNHLIKYPGWLTSGVAGRYAQSHFIFSLQFVQEYRHR